MTASDNEWYNEWQQMTKSDSDWQRMIQRVTTSDTTNGTTNENEWKLIRASKREWHWFQNETIYAMYNYNIFSNLDYL